MSELVGVSGVIGSGKDYLSTRLMEELRHQGFSVSDISFAYPLKTELTTIIEFVRKELDNGVSVSQLEQDVTETFNLIPENTHQFVDYMLEEISSDVSLNGWSRSHGVRASLQFLGTDIRRAQYDNYWVDLFTAHAAEQTTDFLFVTDGRFPNEMDAVVDNGGYTFRMDIPADVLEERRQKRDGFAYTEEALNHISEKALDDYTRFHEYVGVTFDTKELVKHILDNVDKQKATAVA